MHDFLAGLGFFSLIGIIIAVKCYREEVYWPKQEAKRTGKDVHVHYPDGMKTFRPNGSTSFEKFF